MQGSYTGLFYEPGGAQPASCGLLTLNLTAAGAFSGKVQLGGARYPVSGQFKADARLRRPSRATNSRL